MEIQDVNIGIPDFLRQLLILTQAVSGLCAVSRRVTLLVRSGIGLTQKAERGEVL
jgi:hypothetical protein